MNVPIPPFENHPATEIFPLMQGEEYDQLVGAFICIGCLCHGLGLRRQVKTWPI